MHQYLQRKYPKKIIPLNGSYLDLQEEWTKLKEDKAKDLSYMLFLCDPWLEEWKAELEIAQPFPRHQTQFLLMSLEPAGEPRGLIEYWLKQIDNSGGTLKEELEVLLIELVRSKYWIAKMGFLNPRCCAQVVATLYRYKIRNLITQTNSKVDYVPVVDIEEYTQPWIDSEVDTLLIENLGLSSWNSYIFEMYKRGYNREEMMTYSHYPQHIIRQEQQELWKRLNTT
jgi:hypothetical protein